MSATPGALRDEPHVNRNGTEGVNMRERLIVLILALGLASASVAEAQAKKPIILVIFGDDIGWYNVSAYNHGVMGDPTPNIDRIPKEGAMFPHLYTPHGRTPLPPP